MELPKLSMPAFLQINISLSTFVNAPVLWVIFGVFFIIYAIISLVLIYHWIAYGMRSKGIMVGATLFIFVSIALFSVSLSALYYF
jgi:hypothetical protein